MMRKVGSHFLAVMAASLVLVSGLQTVASGLEGMLEGVLKWVGGILIWLLIGMLSLPLTLALRFVAERWFSKPTLPAIFVGVAISIAIIPLLHPAMHPGVSFSTYPIQLTIIHVVAGALGGWVWLLGEFGGKRVEN